MPTAPRTPKKKPEAPKQDVALDPRALPKLASDAVRYAATLDLKGKEKKKAAVKHLAESMDAAVRFGPGPIGLAAEAIDGPIAHLLAGLIQGAFHDLRRRKRV